MTSITRRQWLETTAAAGLASIANPLNAARPPIEGRIIDAHVHIWSADTKKYPLMPGFTANDFWYPSYSAEEVLAHGRPAGINRTNLVQMTWYGTDHTYIIDVIKKYPGQFVGTGIVAAVTDVSLADPGRQMTALAEDGIYAFRIRGKSTRPELGDGVRWLDHPGYHTMFQTGAEHNLALSFLMTPGDIPELDRMCTKHPETPVIIDHLCILRPKDGKLVEEEVKAFLAMAKHKRVMVKVGAFYALGKKTPPYTDMLPLIKRVVEAYGPERCMWESDAPKQDKNGHTFQAAVDTIKQHADFLSRSDKEQILVRTAENFFFKRSK